MKSNRSGEQLRCSFCQRPQTAVAKLISSPERKPRFYICDRCVAACMKLPEQALGSVGDKRRRPARRFRITRRLKELWGGGEGQRCSFCQKSQERVGNLISSPGNEACASICNECVTACNKIPKEDQIERKSKSKTKRSCSTCR